MHRFTRYIQKPEAAPGSLAEISVAALGCRVFARETVLFFSVYLLGQRNHGPPLELLGTARVHIINNSTTHFQLAEPFKTLQLRLTSTERCSSLFDGQFSPVPWLTTKDGFRGETLLIMDNK